ncbi:MAG TPA: GNAT family N-acetyltransferase [Chloroflexia bacterium]|nr:GNAT family N-acetyltransferase [Chloroflexia bacterium]
MNLDQKSLHNNSQPDTTVSKNGQDESEYGTLSVFLMDGTPLKWKDTVSDGSLHCRLGKPEEAEAIQAAMDKAGVYEPNDVARRFLRGREVYLGEVTNEDGNAVIATYGWIARTTEPLGKSGFAFEPPERHVWLYDFATIPEFRGRGYYPALLRCIVEDLNQQGVRAAWIGTAPGNGKSARSITRAGFSRVLLTRGVIDPSGTSIVFEHKPALGVSPELVEVAKSVHIRL